MKKLVHDHVAAGFAQRFFRGFVVVMNAHPREREHADLYRLNI